MDLDQFLAAAELLRHPELAGRPVVVGGDGDPTKRGVVSTASYEARAHGVRSGVPLRTAAKRCPDAVFLPVDKPYYEEISTEVMATLAQTVQEVADRAVVEVLGWDEAFVAADTDDPEAGRCAPCSTRVREATGLDCSVGIGQNPLQAKLATDFGKPAGVYRLTHDTWWDVMGDRPTDALWGIGARTAAKLAAPRHHHGPRAGGGRPRRAGRALRPGHRAVAGPPGHRPRPVEGRRHPVGGAQPGPPGHLPGGPHGLGRRASRAARAGAGRRRRRRGRGTAGGAGRGDGPVAVVPHPVARPYVAAAHRRRRPSSRPQRSTPWRSSTTTGRCGWSGLRAELAV